LAILTDDAKGRLLSGSYLAQVSLGSKRICWFPTTIADSVAAFKNALDWLMKKREPRLTTPNSDEVL
jgi:hypothetical protein